MNGYKGGTRAMLRDLYKLLKVQKGALDEYIPLVILIAGIVNI
jgi:hypothetical protein